MPYIGQQIDENGMCRHPECNPDNDDRPEPAEPKRFGDGTRLCKCGQVEAHCRCEPAESGEPGGDGTPPTPYGEELARLQADVKVRVVRDGVSCRVEVGNDRYIIAPEVGAHISLLTAELARLRAEVEFLGTANERLLVRWQEGLDAVQQRMSIRAKGGYR